MVVRNPETVENTEGLSDFLNRASEVRILSGVPTETVEISTFVEFSTVLFLPKIYLF